MKRFIVSFFIVFFSTSVFGQLVKDITMDLEGKPFEVIRTNDPFPSTLFNERRLALVVGISNYQYITNLPNCGNDADAMTTKMNEMGYDVIRDKSNPTKAQLQNIFRNALNYFVQGRYNSFLFYYSGHGTELGSMNVIVPSDFKFDRSWSSAQRIEAITNQGLRLGELMQPFINQAGNKYSIAILDACRNIKYETEGNPIADLDAGIFNNKPVTRIFSTALGDVAYNEHPEDTRISYFTYYLLRAFNKQAKSPCDIPSLKKQLSEMMRKQDKQIPHITESSNINYAFQFFDCSGKNDFVQSLGTNGILNVSRAKLVADGEGFVNQKHVEEDKGDKTRALSLAKTAAEVVALRNLVLAAESYVSSITKVVDGKTERVIDTRIIEARIRQAQRVGDYKVEGNSVKVTMEVDEANVISLLKETDSGFNSKIYNRFNENFDLGATEQARMIVDSIIPVRELKPKVEFQVDANDANRLYRPGQKQKIHVVDEDGSLLWTNYTDKVNEKDTPLGEMLSLAIEAGKASELANLNKVQVLEDGTLVINIKDLLGEQQYKKLKGGGKLLKALPYLIQLIDIGVKVAKR